MATINAARRRATRNTGTGASEEVLLELVYSIEAVAASERVPLAEMLERLYEFTEPVRTETHGQAIARRSESLPKWARI
jgi:hypothetical protein